MRRRRLIFESLGQRRVLAVITGSVFHDVDGSMRAEPSEVRLESRLAFIDANENAQLDSGEAYSVADADGFFRFEDLPQGTYPVRLFDGSANQRQTFPVGPSQSTLPASVENALDAALAGDSIHVLTSETLVQIDTSGTHATEFPLQFSPTGLIAAVSGDANGNGSASIVAGTFMEEGVQRSGLWMIPTNRSETGLIHYNAAADAFTDAESAMGADGNGVIIASDDDRGTILAIQVTNAADEDQTGDPFDVSVTSTLVTVPSNTQVLSSGAGVDLSTEAVANQVGSRSVFAWPIESAPSESTTGESESESPVTPALKTTLWSNTASNWIAGTETVIVGATELISFDDAAGLLAVRYAEGNIGVLDVDAGFAQLHQLPATDGPLKFIPGQDIVAAIGASDTGHTLSIHDIRAAQELASHSIDFGAVGQPISILPSNAIESFFLLGESGVTSIQLNQAAPHQVEINSSEDLVEIEFGVQTEGENDAPTVPSEVEWSGNEDETLTVDASEIAALVADADRDRLVSLIAESPRSGSVDISSDGEIRYQPEQDFNGTDSFAVQFHDGQSISDPVRFSVNVAAQPDAPTGISFFGDGIPEHTEGRYEVGSLQIQDVDIGDRYDLSVADSRFRVEDSTLVLINGGMNYEFESEILLSLSGYDTEAGEYFGEDIIVRILDENDPVQEVGPTRGEVYENTDRVLITTLEAMDEDLGQTITFSVDDPRFEAIGDKLYLKEGESIDYETESVVVLTITADDNAGSNESVEFQVSVLDVPEAVSELSLSNETVLELEMGATVGDVEINGVALADSYEVSVDDPRFEIDGSTLKLLDDQSVRRSAAEQIELTITAQDTAQEYDPVSAVFVIEVLENETPFHNDENPHDVDGNGDITPLDALAIINYLNLYGPGPVGPGDPGYGYDVNGDGQVTTLDALLVINILNTIQNAGTVNGERTGNDATRDDHGGADNNVPSPTNADQGIPPETIGGTRNSGAVGPVNDAPIASESNLSGSWAVDSPANSSSLPEQENAQTTNWLRDIQNEDEDPELAYAIDELILLLEQSH